MRFQVPGSRFQQEEPWNLEPETWNLFDYFSTILTDVRRKKPTSHIAVAVSGGADSMALALLAHDWCAHQHCRLTALTVDHGLRAESAIEAAQVAAWMVAHGIAHHILTPEPMPDIANLPTRAREMRYGALTAWCAGEGARLLLVAHHADDQAETVALQRHRGESPPSRSGMALASQRGDICVVRPLLGTRKRTLIAYLQDQSQPWIEDPTNASEQFARNRLRRTLDDATIHALWLEAQAQGERRHADDLARNKWVARHVRGQGPALLVDETAWRALPDAPRMDLLSRAVRAVGGNRFRSRRHETVQLDERLRASPQGKATLGHCLILWSGDGTIRITPEPGRGEPLDRGTESSHISRSNPLKQLVSEPFWWFNYPLL